MSRYAVGDELDGIRVGDDAPRNYGAPVHGEQRHSSMAATKQEMAAAREAATEQAAAEMSATRSTAATRTRSPSTATAR